MLDSKLGLCYTVNMSQETLPVEADDPEIADPTGEQTLLSRISHMAGSEKVAEAKADYLGFRACGFPVRQACYLSDNTESTIRRWRKSDPEFARVETEELSTLQSSVSRDLIQLDFLRNMRMAMRTDAKILYKAVQCLDALTNREFKVLQRIRGMYSPSDLMAMTRALNPGGEEPGDFAAAVQALLQARDNDDQTTIRTLQATEVTVAKGHNAQNEDESPSFEGESEEV